MSEERAMLVNATSRIFSDLCTRTATEAAESGSWPSDLWNTLEDAGVTLAATSETRGGAGVSLADTLALVKLAGTYAAMAPLAETLLAEHVLAAAGLPPLSGPTTIAPALNGDTLSLHRDGKSLKIKGALKRIPWARHASAVVVVAELEGSPATFVVRRPPISSFGSNLAGEPRDSIDLNGLSIGPGDFSVGAGFTIERMRALGAMYRASALAGTLERILEITVGYVQERVQFGKPIAKFQAVQQQCAILAGEVAASSAAVQAAVDALSSGDATFEIAAAKQRSSQSAGVSTEIAHQLHGAIGFTREHSLQLYTRRAWSWREEFGDESEWAIWIGNSVAKIGGDSLWDFITRSTRSDNSKV